MRSIKMTSTRPSILKLALFGAAMLVAQRMFRRQMGKVTAGKDSVPPTSP